MATGTQEQQVAAQGMDLSQIADVVNRQKIGNQRLRNEMMRQGVTDPNAFALQNKDTLQQAQQPNEMRFAGTEQQQMYSNAALSNLREMYGIQDYSQYTEAPEAIDYSKFDRQYVTPADGAPTLEYTNPGEVAAVKKAYQQDYSNYVLNQLLQGKSVSSDDLKNIGFNISQFASSKNDSASKQLKQIFDPLYTSTYTKDILTNLGQQLGISASEIAKIAGTVAASYYDDSTNINKAPFKLGTADYTKQYVDALLKYAEQSGSNLNTTGLKEQAYQQSGDLYNYLRKMAKAKDSGGGLFGGIFDFLDPILDDINPLHDTFQNAIADLGGYDSQKEAFNAIAPLMVALFVPGGYGAYINAANSASQGNWTGAALSVLGQYGSDYLASSSYGGAPVESVDAATGAHTVTNAGGIFDSGYSLGSVYADRAAQQALLNSTINYAKTGDLESSLLSAAAGVTGGAAEGYITNLLKQQGLSDIASKMFGGAASGGIQSLFSGNNPIAGSLYGSMSGGLHGYLNTLGRGSEGVDLTNQQDQRNKQIAQSATNLAKLFSRNL